MLLLSFTNEETEANSSTRPGEQVSRLFGQWSSHHMGLSVSGALGKGNSQLGCWSGETLWSRGHTPETSGLM